MYNVSYNVNDVCKMYVKVDAAGEIGRSPLYIHVLYTADQIFTTRTSSSVDKSTPEAHNTRLVRTCYGCSNFEQRRMGEARRNVRARKRPGEIR